MLDELWSEVWLLLWLSVEVAKIKAAVLGLLVSVPTYVAMGEPLASVVSRYPLGATVDSLRSLLVRSLLLRSLLLRLSELWVDMASADEVMLLVSLVVEESASTPAARVARRNALNCMLGFCNIL